MEDSFTPRSLSQGKRSLSLHDLTDNPTSGLASGFTSMSISQDEAKPRHGRNDLGPEDLRILSRRALEELVIDLCDADPVNTSMVRNVLRTVKIAHLEAEEAQRAAEDELARGRYSSWETLNKGAVEIEHVRPLGQTQAKAQTSDVESIVFSDVSSCPPLRVGEAICKNCFKRYLLQDNGPQDCKYHPGRPQHILSVTDPEENEGSPASGSSPYHWIRDCCGRREPAVDTWLNPCQVGEHRPLVANSGPPSVGDQSDEEQREEKDDSPSNSDEPSSMSLDSSQSDESFTLQA